MTLSEENIIQGKKHISKLLEPGIIENAIQEGVHIEDTDVLEIKHHNLSLTKGKRYTVLVSSGYLSSISKEARELTASKEFAMNTVAKAIIVDTTGHQLIGNFYLNVNKPHIKTKLFTNREKALNWLREILNTENILKNEWS